LIARKLAIKIFLKFFALLDGRLRFILSLLFFLLLMSGGSDGCVIKFKNFKFFGRPLGLPIKFKIFAAFSLQSAGKNQVSRDATTQHIFNKISDFVENMLCQEPLRAARRALTRLRGRKSARARRRAAPAAKPPARADGARRRRS